MKKTIITLIIFILTLGLMYSEKLGTISEVVNPFSLIIDSGKIYIVEGPKVYIYSLKNLKLLKIFGKKGEGPKEFSVRPMTNMGNIEINAYPKFILANSLGKISYFTKDGVYQKEIRTAGSWRSFKILDDKFVGFGGTNSVGNIRYIALKIYNAVDEPGSNFFDQQTFFNNGEVNPFYMIGPYFFCHEGKIFVEKNKNEIQIFNKTGKKVSTLDINKGYKKVLVTKKYKDTILKYFKAEPAFRTLYERIKRDIKYSKYLPGIYNFVLADKKIYILRWNDGSSDQREIAVFNLKGKLIKTSTITFHMKSMMIPYAYTIKDGILYQLIENEDDEGKWNLLATKI